MSKVVRYFHIRLQDYCGPSTHGGGTVKVTGDTNYPGQVDVQYTKCSSKDQFVKREGRSFADKAPIKVIPLRNLGKELDDIAKRCGDEYSHEAQWLFALKYFLPKE